MLFNSYNYEIIHEQFHWTYLQGDIKLLLVSFTVNDKLKFEIEIVHDLPCHPIYGAESSASKYRDAGPWGQYNVTSLKAELNSKCQHHSVEMYASSNIG